MAESTRPPTEPVLALDVQAGDVLLYDGRQLEVTAYPNVESYHEGDRVVRGLCIPCRDGRGRVYLYRGGAELLSRVSRAGR